MTTLVYFMDARALHMNQSGAAKVAALFDAAKFQNLFNEGEYVAIKLHMGEWNNTAYIRPVYVRILVEKIKQYGGIPFVTDTCTLPYTPWCGRSNPIEYMKTAARNGFTAESCGAPIVIADGFGQDDVRVDLPEGSFLKEQYIASGYAMASAIIVLSHFKGHPLGTFGGAIKNIGVGCASQRGKMNLHGARHPVYGLHTFSFNPAFCPGLKCANAQRCMAICPANAIKITESGINWDRGKCIGCTAHIFATMECGVFTSLEIIEGLENAAIGISDSAKALMNLVGKDHIGFINLALDITPWCDCIPWSDTPIIPDIGYFACVGDPVAIDVACLDKTTESAGIPESAAESKDVMDAGVPKMAACGSMLGVSENIQIMAGVKNGLGTTDYKLKPVAAQNIKKMEEGRLLPDGNLAGVHLKRFYKIKNPLPNPDAEDGGFKRNPKRLDMTNYLER